MENPSDPSNHQSKKALQRNSNGHLSMSDTDSTISQADCYHSLGESPLRSDDPCFQHENYGFGLGNSKSGKSLVSGDKYYSPLPSPGKSTLSATSPMSGKKAWRPGPKSDKLISGKGDIPATAAVDEKAGERENSSSENRELAVVLGGNRMVKELPAQEEKKLETFRDGGRVLEEEMGGERRSTAGILRRSQKGASLRTASLMFRVFAAIVCLISFSVMAADKTQGWSGDSFYRYQEYRYSLAVNVVGFVYSSFQAYDLGYRMGTRKQAPHRPRYCFDFTLDQILAYLLMSASSSAATRVNDWILNWGSDEFTNMASASIAMSFLAFAAFALNSLISGYNLCTTDSS